MVAVAGSPWGPRGGRHHPRSPRGQDQAWLGLEMFAGGLLSLIVPPEPCWAGGGLATLSWLSQCPCPHDRERAGCADGVAPWDPDRVPESHRDPNPPCWHPAQLAPCPPHERAVSPAHLRAPCRERGIHSVGGCPAPRRGTPTPRAARAGDAASPLTAATGTSQALAFNMHEERGGGQGRPVLGEQVDVAIPWGQSRAERGARGRSPPKAQQRGAGAHPPSRMLARGRVNCPTKSLQEVLSWSSTTKRTSASSGACSWKLSVSSQRGLKPAALSQGGHGHHGHGGHPRHGTSSSHCHRTRPKTGFGSLVAWVSPQGGVWGE